MSFRWPAALVAGALATSPVLAQTAPQAGDPAKAQALVTQVCSGCHGPDGNSTQAANPSLAGQHAAYTLKQLMNFRPRDGKAPERPSPVMGAIVAQVPADQLRGLAAYFEGQTPRSRAARDPQLVKLGQALYRGGNAARGIAACTACHGPSGAGVPAQFPRLAGQQPEYTVAQLKAFRVGERSNDPNRAMRSLAERLTDREIAAVAEYIAGLR